MNIILYQNTTENIRVDKTKFLVEVLSLEGTLREECSLISPEIVIQLVELPTFNYVYIEEFNRYYFVEDIVSVRNNLWRIALQIDTLMSFKDDILKMECIIARQENDFNPYIKDDILPLLPERSINIIDGHNARSGISSMFFSNAAKNTDIRCYVLMVFDGTQSYHEGPSSADYVDNLDAYKRTVSPHLSMSPYTSMCACYALSYKELISFAGEVSDFDFGELVFGNKGDYVLGCMMYPFDVTQGQGIVDKIIINQREMKTTGVALEPTNTSSYSDSVGSFRAIEAIEITPYYKGDKNLFLNFAPYSEYKLFLPYYGWVDIDNKYFLSKGRDNLKANYLWIHLAIDYSTGQAAYRLSVGYSPDSNYYYDNTEIDLIQFQLGVAVPFGSNNKAEWANNMILGSIKTAINVGTFFATAGASEELATLNASKRRGRIGKRAKRKAALKRKISTIEETGQAFSDIIDTVTQPLQYKPIGGSGEGFIMYNESFFPYIIQSYSVVEEPEDYARIYGRPSLKTNILNNLIGYTQCYDFHLSHFPTATVEEMDEIDSRLREGIII